MAEEEAAAAVELAVCESTALLALGDPRARLLLLLPRCCCCCCSQRAGATAAATARARPCASSWRFRPAARGGPSAESPWRAASWRPAAAAERTWEAEEEEALMMKMFASSGRKGRRSSTAINQVAKRDERERKKDTFKNTFPIQ